MERIENNDMILIKHIDAMEIQSFQQNRYPLLFIDYVDIVEVGKSAKGHKNFSYNEWFFPAHFEDEPNVPGFVQMEALTQMFLMTFLTIPGNEGKKTAFLKETTEFKKKIIPGDRLDIESVLTSYRRGLAKGSSVGYINGEVACKADFVICIPDIMKGFVPMKKNTADTNWGGYRVTYLPDNSRNALAA